VRGFLRRGGNGSSLGARLRYSDTSPASGMDSALGPRQGRDLGWFEIVGVVRNLGLDPDDEGNERPHVFHAASAGTVEPFVMSVRARGNPAVLVARLPTIAGNVDPGLYVQEARPLDGWIGNAHMTQVAGALAGATALVLFLSSLGIYSLMSVNVSRRTREIGLRVALGARPRHVLTGIVRHAVVVMGSGVTVGGGVLLVAIARWEENVALFVGWLGVTAAVMLAATLLASIVPARRALGINPTDALRET